MNEIPENIQKLVPGKRYRIVMDDCCIQGVLEGIFMEYDIEDDEAVFDIGSIGPYWGQWSTEEIE